MLANSNKPPQYKSPTLFSSLKHGPLFLAVRSIAESQNVNQKFFPAVLARYPGFSALDWRLKLHALPAIIAIASGCRIGEILRAKVSQITDFGQLVVAGEKGSKARVIALPVTPQIMSLVRAMPQEARVFPFSYGQVWHACKVAGIYEEIPGRGNHVVTHSGRYAAAAKAVKTLGYNEASGLLGHASRATLANYVMGDAVALRAAEQALGTKIRTWYPKRKKQSAESFEIKPTSFNFIISEETENEHSRP